MNTLVIVLIAAVVLVCAYAGYGRWLAKTWGVDPNAKTPAVRLEDGKDYVPTNGWTVFAHQFSSIAGAGPVTGAIQAAAFGWLPVLLWVLIGGVFFGAVQDFAALYASMKNDGKSMGVLIEKYIGTTGRRLFLLFCWVFSLLVIAAFGDIVATTFNGFAKDGSMVLPNAAAASISMLFIFVAIAFGLFIKKFNPSEKVRFVIAIVLLIAMLYVGIDLPIYLDRMTWLYIIFAYIFFASIMPMWLLKQPRDYISAFLLLMMIAGGVIGIFIAQPTLNMPAFTSFSVGGKDLFPILFITIACGALSGFHSLVSSGTSSKQVSNETDMLPVGFGAMVLESFVGVIAIVTAGIMFGDMNTAGTGALNGGVASTPFQIFAAGIARGMETIGVNNTVATVFMTMNVSALALTSLDAVARIARSSFQEFFFNSNDAAAQTTEKVTGVRKVMTNVWFSTAISLLVGLVLCFGGYLNIWPLFGASNQLLGGMTMITLAVFCKCTGRKGAMLYVPVAFLLVCTFTSLVQSIFGCVNALAAGTAASVFNSSLQLVFAVLLVVLGLIVAVNCLKELFSAKDGSMPDEEPEWTELGRKNCAAAAADAKVAPATSTPAAE